MRLRVARKTLRRWHAVAQGGERPRWSTWERMVHRLDVDRARWPRYERIKTCGCLHVLGAWAMCRKHSAELEAYAASVNGTYGVGI